MTDESENGLARVSDEALDSDQGISRTHYALGAFPFAIFSVGAGGAVGAEGKSKKLEASLVDVKSGGVIVQELAMITNDPLGLPRGSDESVLIALLDLLMKTPGETDEIYFRKAKVLERLGVRDTPRAREDVAKAIERYRTTTFDGKNVWESPGTKVKARTKRYLIVAYDIVDERNLPAPEGNDDRDDLCSI